MSGLPASLHALPSPRGGRGIALLVLAAASVAGGLAAGPGILRLALVSSGATVALTVLLLALAEMAATWRRRLFAGRVRAIVAEDAAPCFTTDAVGTVLYRNRAAEARFERAAGATLAGTLGDIFAHPAAVLYRLQSRAAKLGAAREDVVTRRGHVRLAVHRLDDGAFLWRLEEMLDRAGPGGGRGAEGLGLPMLVAARSGTILFMNEALRRLVGGRPRTLDRIFTDTRFRPGEPVLVAGATGPVRALVAEIEGTGDRREIYLLPTPPEGPRPVAVAEDDLPVALVRLGPGGVVLAANRRARDMLSLSAEGKVTLPELLDGPGRPLADWLDAIAAGRLPPRPEVMRLRRTQEDRFVQVVPWRAPDGALSAVLTDATALKTLEAQYAQGQKMQAIGQLAGGIAHDFNNILTAISGHCDLLLISRDAADPDYADLMQIQQNANRAAALVSQLLAFSRKQPMLPERLDLAEVLADVTHLLRRLVGEKVTLELAPSGDPGAVKADRRQIEQVLMNLVVNARDAMPQGGPIRIATARRTLFMPLQRGRATVPPGDYAIITVSDRGCGIPPDLHDRIFEPFYTTKRAGEGTGLGLAMVYGIVKQSGGFIFVDSEPGEGSTFTLWLPLDDPSPARGTEPGDGAYVVPQILSHPEALAARAPRLPRTGVREPVSATQDAEVADDQRREAIGAGDLEAQHAPPSWMEDIDETGLRIDDGERPDWPVEQLPTGFGQDPDAASADSAHDAAKQAAAFEGAALPGTGTGREENPGDPPVLPRDPATLGAHHEAASRPSSATRAGDTTDMVFPDGAAGDRPGDDVGGPSDGQPPLEPTSDPPNRGVNRADLEKDPTDTLRDDQPARRVFQGSNTVVAGTSVDPDAVRAPHGLPSQSTDAGPACPVRDPDDEPCAQSRDRAGGGWPSEQPAPFDDLLHVPASTDGLRQDFPAPQPSAPDTRIASTSAAGTGTSVPSAAALTGAGRFAGHAAPAGAAAADRGARASGARRRNAGVVLLVEDEAPVRTFASRALRLRGFTVIEAECAEDALLALADPSLTVDVFVTDVTMPGMDGPTWVRMALENRPGVRVVFVSGYPEETLPQGRAAIPDSVFLPKPFSLDELTRTVQRQLH